MKHEFSEAYRLKRVPPYVFSVVDKMKLEVEKKGVNIIDFSLGSPDLKPPQKVIDKLKEALDRDDVHNYSRYDGEIEREFRKEVANWYERKFGVVLNPDKEIIQLIGSKEGIAHFAMGVINSEDIVIVPSPTYPAHFNGIIASGGIVYYVPLLEENNFVLDFKKIDPGIFKLAKILIVSYPQNPTTAVVQKEFYEELVDFLKDRDIIVISDITYSDLIYDENYKPTSILEVKGAKDFCIEFNTMSKSYSMAGWRVGFAAGNSKLIEILKKTKDYIDFGVFKAIQLAAIEALRYCDDYIIQVKDIYYDRIKTFVEGVNRAGWRVEMSKSTFYVWAKIPMKFSALTSLEFAKVLLEETGVVCSPGSGFGEYGEGFVRFAMVQDKQKIKEAVLRITRFLTRED
ncbi:MAG: aminotransferase class I/II-fold pyridoxal phosphate-dependent enzyme [Brevinematia bacterium]